MANSFNDIKANLSKIINFSIKEKETSVFMKFLAFLLFFNKDFLSGFITTIGKTIYFPKKYFETNHAKIVLCHEFRHIYDYDKYNVLFYIAYLFPQIMFIFSILAFIHWSLIFFILMLLPLPAYFRYKFELNGYLAALFATECLLANKINKQGLDLLLSKQAVSYEENFKNSSYYFMWPFKINIYNMYKNLNKNEDFYIKLQSALK